ncbi:toprim domain-containing protein [Spiroplasma culicicola]|uniref:Recombination protein RecR n=1 Tax=Spiroplasma culicicola AES-1 TaxID=1276246 RepID=W6AF95_9MOLU|nr:toprim domain-containing protein [Spiroplasma culicicola]AHI52349.1 recombination protein RecR [Spiroplasma culicicola AES-1]
MNEILELIKQLDGVGNKAAKKIFFELLTSSQKRETFQKVIDTISKDFKICERCYFYKKNNLCAFCDDKTREQNLICVVSYLSDAQKILDNNFKGLVHVLNGELNFNKNIKPENLKIDKLFDRINKEIEVLLALNLTFEGEVTAGYLASELKNRVKKVSRIARGIPLGGVIDYIDDETLLDAIQNRKSLKKKEQE